MEYEELYFGQRIRIVTTREADGTWRATAELPEIQAPQLASETHASEGAARSAALSAAMAELDRRRARTGKP